MKRVLTFLTITVAVTVSGPGVPAATVIQAEKAAIRTEGGEIGGGVWNLWFNGRVGDHLKIAAKGTYRITVRAYGTPASGTWPQMALMLDGRILAKLDVSRREPADYAFSAELPAGAHEIAVGFLNDRVAGKEDRNLYLDRITIQPPSGVADPALVTKAELAGRAVRREQEVLRLADEQIEKNRKSDATIRVVDTAGRPIAGATIQVRQTGHDFLFGCNIYRFDRFKKPADNAAYKKRFEELFNYATVGFYWRSYEHQRGKPQYDYTDKIIAWCAERGMKLKGHPLLWGHQAGVPVWAGGQPKPDVQRQRVLDIMRRYSGKIDFWEVVNEPSHCRQVKIDQPYRWAREADPKAYTIVNDYYVMANGYPPFFELCKKALADGVPFDGIGIQAHEPRTMRFPLDRVWEILDKYATLGKELHVTEFTPASSGKRITGSHLTGNWDEAAQADYAAKFYRVCFGHPAMRGITWWDLCDNGSWLRGGGMLRADTTPKPVYNALKRLIHQDWTTNVTGKTDATGHFRFRGFHGTYRAVVQPRGKRAEKDFRVKKGGGNELTITLPRR